MQYEDREHNGDHRHQVDVDAGFHRAQHPQGEIPGDEAEGGGPQTKIDNVHQIHSVCKTSRVQCKIHEEQRRNHEQQPIEENTLRDLQGAIAEAADFLGKDGVNRPHHGGADGQDVSDGADFHRTAGKADQDDSGDGHQKAQEKVFLKPFPRQKKMGQDRGKKGRDGNDYSHVGGQGVGQGHIFQQVVQADPGESRAREHQLLFHPSGFKTPRTHDAKGQIAHDKAEEQDFDGREIPQQHLGGDKRSTPDHNGKNGSHVAS